MLSPNRSFIMAALSMTACGSLAAIAQGKDAKGVAWPDRSGQAHICGGLPEAPIELRVSRRTAGAIDSLSWAGKQFVNASDHGREFQSASYFDRKGGCYNPTEAGSATDGTGAESTSRLLFLKLGAGSLTTRTRMAFWLGPGQQNKDCNSTWSTGSSVLSDDVLTKTIRIGSDGIPSAISYDVTFLVGRQHTYGLFEALTGYMPPDFRNFWAFEPQRNQLTRESNQQGGQALPLIVSTDDGRYALGVVSPGPTRPTYGRWDFTQPTMAAPTIKWNCVFAKDSVKPGEYHFVVYVVIGTLGTVQADLRAMCSKLEPGVCSRQ